MLNAEQIEAVIGPDLYARIYDVEDDHEIFCDVEVAKAICARLLDQGFRFYAYKPVGDAAIDNCRKIVIVAKGEGPSMFPGSFEIGGGMHETLLCTLQCCGQR